MHFDRILTACLHLPSTHLHSSHLPHIHTPLTRVLHPNCCSPRSAGQLQRLNCLDTCGGAPLPLRWVRACCGCKHRHGRHTLQRRCAQHKPAQDGGADWYRSCFLHRAYHVGGVFGPPIYLSLSLVRSWFKSCLHYIVCNSARSGIYGVWRSSGRAGVVANL